MFEKESNMFSGYNLKINENFFYDLENDFYFYKRIGETHLRHEIAKYKLDINHYINNDTIDGNKIQEDCFPNINADIFISHSHKDKDLANALAGWINDNFDLNVFIDSNVWGYADELLESINSKYSNKQKNPDGGYLYDYESCNYASQHVNLILSIALQKMIDKVECIILLNTDNSINVFNDLTNRFNETYSPWIYSEIICTQIVRKKPLLCYRNYSKLIHADESVNFVHELKIGYKISLDHLDLLTVNDLNRWENDYKLRMYDTADSYEYAEYPLDILYSFKHPKELENTKQISAHCEYSQEQWKLYFEGKTSIRFQNDIYMGKLCECKEFINGNCPFINNRGNSYEQ